MENHTLKILEFDKIIDSLKKYCMSESGEKVIDRQEFTQLRNEWKEKTEAVNAIADLFKNNINFPELSFPEIEKAVKNLSVEGSVLELLELSSVMIYLDSADRLKKYFFSSIKNRILLDKVSYDDTKDIVNYLKIYLRNDGTLKEDSIKELVSIKKRIGRVNKTINSTVNNYLTGNEYSSYLQDTTSTIKDGRIVLPVKENFKGKIKGIIHGKSSRGITIFIEPMDLVEQNNELIELEELYKIEIFRILKRLTELLRENAEILKDINHRISVVDTYIARGRFSYFNKLIFPEIIETGVDLKNVRHYLLGEKAVPINILINDDTRALIISGPNTGGKTLALKTAGLAVLMNQFWMGIPADEGSAVSLFDNVLADIGDEQSVTGSLSTFSAHMKNVAEIIEKSTEKSLILLDEPGTGTDPEEGSALSISFIETLLDKKLLLMVSTHQGVIKNFATTNRFCENVSVAYDPVTYKPEYRIIYGLPGESYGIDIAMKNGIPMPVIEKARNFMGSEKVNINKLLKEISEKMASVENARRLLEFRENNIKEDERKLQLKELSLRQKQHFLKEEEEKETTRFLREYRKKVENLIREIREGDLSREKIAESKKIFSEIEEENDLIQKEIKKEDEDLSRIVSEDFEIREGMVVLVGEQRVVSTVIRKTKKDRFLVSTGSMKIEVPEKDIYFTKQPEKKLEIKSYIKIENRPVFELDLRGERLEDAIRKLQDQLDTAVLTNFREFSIIHGLGEGVLQKGVWDYLSSCSSVLEYSFAHPDQGGFGKTMVHLK